jgi:hypothetical protein
VKGLEPSTPGTTIQCSNQLSYTHRTKVILARQKGFEPLTYGLEGRCSIQLSYWRPDLLLSIKDLRRAITSHLDTQQP